MSSLSDLSVVSISKFFNGGSPQAIFFDLDGTLVDSVPDLAFAIDAMLEQLELPLAGVHRVRAWVGNGADALIKSALDEQSDQADADEYFTRARGLFFTSYAQNLSQRSVVYPGVISALTILKNQQIPLALITNKPIEFTLPLLKHLCLHDFFDEIIGGDSLAHKKPHPLPLEHAAKSLSKPIEYCLMVGDSRSDIHAARRAGCPVLAVTYGYNHGENIEHEKPDSICDDLSDVFISD